MHPRVQIGTSGLHSAPGRVRYFCTRALAPLRRSCYRWTEGMIPSARLRDTTPHLRTRSAEFNEARHMYTRLPKKRRESNASL